MITYFFDVGGATREEKPIMTHTRERQKREGARREREGAKGTGGKTIEKYRRAILIFALRRFGSSSQWVGINSSSSETFPDLGTGEGSFVTPIYLILWCCRGNIKTGKERERARAARGGGVGSAAKIIEYSLFSSFSFVFCSGNFYTESCYNCVL